MIPFLPFVMLGSFFLVTSKKSKSKAKPVSTHRVIESGSVANLPKLNDPVFSMELRVGEAIEIIATESPSASWKVTRRGVSVKMVRESRKQDAVTNTVVFIFKAIESGTTVTTFEKIGRDGSSLEARRLEIVVE